MPLWWLTKYKAVTHVCAKYNKAGGSKLWGPHNLWEWTSGSILYEASWNTTSRPCEFEVPLWPLKATILSPRNRLIEILLCILTSIINVSRMLILELPWKKWPPCWIYYPSISCIAAKAQSSAFMKAYLMSTNGGNASWTVNGCQEPRQGTKPASGKIANSSSYSCKIVYSTTAHSWM